jgi:chorismate--pyruvate lyase
MWGPEQTLPRTLSPELRGWLLETGLLTHRLRAACGDRYHLRLLDQRIGFLNAELQSLFDVRANTAFVREIALCCGQHAWVFAQTFVPDVTLELHPWLAELGDSPLGETLAGIAGVERDPVEFAELSASHPLIERALHGADVKPLTLFARRTCFRLRGRPLLVQEVFLPGLGRC